MHHTVATEHVNEHEVLTNSRAIATEKQLQQVQKLYDDTRTLLHNMISSTSNASHTASLILQHSLQHIGQTVNSSLTDSSASNPISSLSHYQQLISTQRQQIALLQKALLDEKQLRAESTDFGAGKSSSIEAFKGTLGDSKWLVIGIPTVPRLNEEDYLLHSLETIAKQLPREPSDLMYMKIVLVVVNVSLGPHRRFEEAKARYAPGAHPLAAYFVFTQLTDSDQGRDPKAGANAANDPGNANVPGYKVRKQSRNVASVMQLSYSLYPEGTGQYYMFLEDDMQLCKHGFIAINYLLQKASRYHPNWLAIRASYGMNGIFMHMKDVPVFSAYLIKHQLRRPPDHLVVEWFAGETSEAKDHRGSRANIGFRHNLFDHIGKFSSLRKEIQTSFPRCYELLTEPTVFQVEAFNLAQCPRDDIWPCKGVMGGRADIDRLALEGLGPHST